MGRVNLYIHYNSVTNYVVSRGIDVAIQDFDDKYIPNNVILAEEPGGYGRFDAKTNFKILRGQEEVIQYFTEYHHKKIRLSNWVDFESIDLMHQLTPTEIAELLYLFHSSLVLRSAFFYKLQNNYVYVTMPNGLNKTYYRHIAHFYPRLQRVVTQAFKDLVNESRHFFIGKRDTIPVVPMAMMDQIIPFFAKGLKFGFDQAYSEKTKWSVPLFVIEDELTLLTQKQSMTQCAGVLSYDDATQEWILDLSMSENRK